MEIQPISECDVSLAGNSSFLRVRSVRGKVAEGHSRRRLLENIIIAVGISLENQSDLKIDCLLRSGEMLFRSIVDRGVCKRRRNGEHLWIYSAVQATRKLAVILLALFSHPSEQFAYILWSVI